LLKPFYCIPLPKNLAPYVLDHLGYKKQNRIRKCIFLLPFKEALLFRHLLSAGGANALYFGGAAESYVCQ
jgi:hypothetical protein